MDGALPPYVAGGAVCVEGPLPPCVTIGPAWMVTMGGGNLLMIVYMIILGPLATLWVTGCDVDMGPLAKVRPKRIRICISHGVRWRGVEVSFRPIWV